MKTSLLFFVIAPFFISRVFASPENDEQCPSYMCGDKSFVKYPFRFMNVTREECGYPGFDLDCDSGDNIILNLPNSGEFYVGDVNYATQEIQLQDPDNCLPGRLMKLLSNNFSNSSPFSPFSGEYFRNYTFVECPTPFLTQLSFAPVIRCLSNSTFSVTALSVSDLPSSLLLHDLCHIIGTITVPVTGNQYQDEENDVVFSLSKTLTLSWNDPDCRSCESKGGVCSGGATVGATVCTDSDDLSSAWKRWQKVAKVIGFAIFLPLVFLPFFMMFVLCCRGRLATERHRRNIGGLTGGGAGVAEMVVQQTAVQQPAVIKPGLDESVIESYPKVVLSERLGKLLVDVMCCICLDEYVTGVTIRWLPECEHYFHVDCINKWLKVNKTCPVCRI